MLWKTIYSKFVTRCCHISKHLLWFWQQTTVLALTAPPSPFDHHSIDKVSFSFFQEIHNFRNLQKKSTSRTTKRIFYYFLYLLLPETLWAFVVFNLLVIFSLISFQIKLLCIFVHTVYIMLQIGSTLFIFMYIHTYASESPHNREINVFLQL